MNLHLPVMRCDEGCGECCGPVPASPVEFEAIRRFIIQRDVTPRNQGPLTCPFYQEGKCAIYEVRPFVCRLYGHVERMTCPRGYNANISPAREAALCRRHVDFGRPARWLHELVEQP